MSIEIKRSADGSHTLYNSLLNEHYHSMHGAIQESEHVFIGAGLRACHKKDLHVLEIGFGTGLNALLTFFNAYDTGKTIYYEACEPYPLPQAVWQQLNYPEILEYAGATDVFEAMHQADWDTDVKISERFVLCKRSVRAEDAIFRQNLSDLIFFDSFCPAVQPELWTKDIFLKLFKATAGNGILVTYSAKGQVRRNLAEAGYMVERLPGPPGKREMLRGRKLL